MKELTVVVRRTKFTPRDAHVGSPGLFPPSKDTQINVSCIFTADLMDAKRIANHWRDDGYFALVGGPACDDPGGEFIPGKFIKAGVTITSRGCVRKCPWCYVPKREGMIREIEIKPGNIVQDNNLLACSREHISKVFQMLKTQRAIEFKGGIDPRLLKDWHIEEMRSLRIREIWVSADHQGYRKQSVAAIEKLTAAGFNRNKIRCYVMVGFNETINQAEERARDIFKAGALPFVQLYDAMWVTPEWRTFARNWSRPAIIKSRNKKEPHAASIDK